MARKSKQVKIDTVRKPTELRFIPRMTTGAKLRRRQFVIAYLQNNLNVVVAYKATGYKGKDAYAKLKGCAMLNEPYVQALLWKFINAMDESDIVTTREVLFGLKKEANFMDDGTTHSARVAAWTNLGKILGLGKEDSNGGTIIKSQGNVMVVPMTQSEDEWEKMAEASQKRLKSEVKTT